MVPIVDRVASGGDRAAAVDPAGTSTFSQLDFAARARSPRRCVMVGETSTMLVSQFSPMPVATSSSHSWGAGKQAPLSFHCIHPIRQAELDYVVSDADASADRGFAATPSTR